MKNFSAKILAPTIAATLAAALPAPAARADTIYASSTGDAAKAVKYDGTVNGIDNGELTFTNASNFRKAGRPLKEVVRLTLDNQPAFNAAEAAYVEGQWDAAVDGYAKALRGAVPDWQRRYADPKLIAAAAKAGRFDAAVQGYVDLVKLDPAAAARRKPDLPSGKSTFLDTAIADVRGALPQANKPEQKQALLSFLIDLQRAKGDDAGAANTLQDLVKIAGDSADTPENRALLEQVRLGEAKVALDAGDADQAAKLIDANRALFTDPDAQAEALYTLAGAARIKAQKSADPRAKRDAAIAYMRVVAHFKDAPGHPRVPESLLATAELLDELKEPAPAAAMFRQIAADYPDAPAADAAKQKLAATAKP